jgi:TIR domain
MAGKVFINYRRGDDPGFTQALYQRLEQEFSDGALFMDVEGQIKPGDDFVAELSRQVAECDVLLAVIGPRWSDLMARRAGDPDDFVAIEIRAALDLRKRVIPVLVGGAPMPRAHDLPESIRALARRNAVGLRPERFKADCQGLVTALKDQLAVAEGERAARTEADQAAAEAEQQKRIADEEARIAAVEERGQAQAGAGLSPAEIAKVVEQANWDFHQGPR